MGRGVPGVRYADVGAGDLAAMVRRQKSGPAYPAVKVTVIGRTAPGQRLQCLHCIRWAGLQQRPGRRPAAAFNKAQAAAPCGTQCPVETGAMQRIHSGCKGVLRQRVSVHSCTPGIPASSCQLACASGVLQGSPSAIRTHTCQPACAAAGGHKAVAAVIAFAADHQQPSGLRAAESQLRQTAWPAFSSSAVAEPVCGSAGLDLLI